MKSSARVTAAPKFQWSFETGKLFKLLPPQSKDTVYRAFHAWFSEARKRESDYMNMEPITDSLNEDETDCLLSMIENATDGLTAYWSRSKSRSNSETGSDPSETISDPSETSNYINNKSNNKNNNTSQKEVEVRWLC